MAKTVLLIEDDALIRQIYKDTLKNAGYNVEDAEDGEEGLKKLNESEWSLALVDIVMPKMTGTEAVKKYKEENNSDKAKKIIFLTNMTGDPEANQAMAIGDGIIVKSEINPGELIDKIKKFL